MAEVRRKATAAHLSPQALEEYRHQIDMLAQKWASGESEDDLRMQYRQLSLDRGTGRAIYLGYSDEALLAILGGCARELGRAPVQKEVFFLYRTYLKTRFGSWPAALRAAGMRRLPAATLPKTDWEALVHGEPEICRQLEALWDMECRIGAPPRRRDFPQAEQLRQRFGPWENVLEAARLLSEWQNEQQRHK